jgi:hypothetical protein
MLDYAMPLEDAGDDGGASFEREGDFQDAVSSSPGKKQRPVLKEEGPAYVFCFVV